MRIETIQKGRTILEQVMTLWRSNSATLGFFPEGAFDEYAAKGQIIGAFDDTGKCRGYLLYRISGERASIVHLCVHESIRERGIARDLIGKLIEHTTHLQGVCLWCRRDYDASNIWQELGFVALADRPGKGLTGKELTFWKRDHERPTLFEQTTPSQTDSKLRVVLDASVFFDLLEDDNRGNQESISLKADWLAPSLDVCITDEMFNEINRRQRRVERELSRKLAHHYQVLVPPPSQWQLKETAIRKLYPAYMTAQDKSDLRHLAKALASEVYFFVTRDGPLLRKAERLYKEFGISVLRPSDIVIHLNELKREVAYQPARFDRTLFQARSVMKGEGGILNEYFQCANQGEGRSRFQKYLGDILAYPNKFECVLVIDSESLPIALIAYGRATPDCLEIPLLRVRQGKLASTLARNLCLRAVRVGAGESRPLVKITDPFITETVSDAIKEVGFLSTENGAIKTTLPFIGSVQDLLNRILSLPPTSSQIEGRYRKSIVTAIESANSATLPTIGAQLERFLWPAKITEIEIPNYILPIKPQWAQELFDEGLAKQTLFAARPELGLNREGVYYRSAKISRGLSARSRILWYVSSDKKFQDSMQIRACSYIDTVVVGKPKDLFRQYRRLGVYEWRDVYELAGENISNEIMAVQFSDTELFSRPIPWRELQRTLREEECPSQIQSPHRISSRTFCRLYRMGTGQ